MLSITVNCLVSFLESLSLYLVFVCSLDRRIKKYYWDVLLIAASTVFLCFLNDPDMGGHGTVLSFFLYLIWGHFFLAGSFRKKCLCMLIWNFLIVLSFAIAGLVAGWRWGISGISVIRSLYTNNAYLTWMAIASDFLLILLTLLYVRWLKWREQKKMPLNIFFSVSCVIIILIQLVFIGFPSFSENKQYNSLYQFEFGAIVLVDALFFLAYILYGYLYQVNMVAYRSKKELQKRKLAKQHSENMALLEQKLFHQRQEMRDRICVFQQLLLSHAYTELAEQESQIDSLLGKQEDILTGNTIFDIILNQKFSWAKQKGIHFQVNIQKVGPLAMEETDIVTLLSNLLDNACEAVEKLKAEKRWIYLEIKTQKDYLFITTENPYLELSMDNKKHLYSTKKNQHLHGRGVGCIRSVVKKYGGSFQYDAGKDLFTVKVTIHSQF